MKEDLLLPQPLSVDPIPVPTGVRQVLTSKTFGKTPALRMLLEYLWRHRELPISEYAIATEALGRSPSFDARIDATVRVQISRLRQRLEKFYEEEGCNCPERLIIPLGSHRVELEPSPLAPSQQLPPTVVLPVAIPGPSLPQPRWRLFLSALCLMLLVISLVEAAFLYKAGSTSSAAKPQVASGWIWQQFFGNGRRTRLILPTPIFFSFKRSSVNPAATVMFRDTEVNEFAQGPESSVYRTIQGQLGQPTLAESYTVTSDTFASVELVRYLDRTGSNAFITSSADAPLEALDTENVIALGTWGTLTPLKPYLERMTFELGPHENYVMNRRPGPGESARIDWVTESPDRTIWPGVVAVLPGASGNTHLLILASRHTSALVSFLTSTNGLQALKTMWERKGSPEFFEVVVDSEMGGRGLVRSWPVALHPYKKNQ